MNNLEESESKNIHPEDDCNRDPCTITWYEKRKKEIYRFVFDMSDQMIIIWSNQTPILKTFPRHEQNLTQQDTSRLGGSAFN